MLFYWAVFFVFALAALTYRVQREVAYDPATQARQAAALLVAIGLLLTLFIGLRFRVGGDWHNYQIAFDDTVGRDFETAMRRSGQEPGYTIISWIAGQLGYKIWFVNLVCAVPFVWGLIKLCRQQPNPWLSLLVAWPFLIVVVGMGFTRQAAAIGFLMAGVADYIERQRLDRCLLYVLLGALFHKTVLIFLPLLFLAGSRNRFFSIALLLIAGIVAYATILTHVGESYGNGYLNARYEAAGAQVRVLMNVLPALLVLVSRDRFYRNRVERNIWRMFAILALIAAAALPFVSSSVVVDRLGMYLIPIQMFALGRVSLVYGKDPSWRPPVIAIMALVMFVWFTYGHYSTGWYPYRIYLSA